ncbi:MAG: Trm112 family protein [Nocardioidaceae bacterium]
MPVHPDLIAILVCPEDRGSLLDVDGDFLYNPRLRRAYPIRDEVPILLTAEARDVDETEHERILARTQRPG